MINFRKLHETIKKALDEEVFVGHIDKEELSPEVFTALQTIAEEDEDGMVIYGKPFKMYIEQLQEQTSEDEENEKDMPQNILDTLGYDFTNKSILEPCCGGGHMIAGIQPYLLDNHQLKNLNHIVNAI